MKDILKIAAKCRNPLLRNALLVVAATGRGWELAERLARAEIRKARRTARAARAAFNQIADAADAAGARGKGDPRFVDPMTAELSVMSEAAIREANARAAIRALRCVGAGRAGLAP